MKTSEGAECRDCIAMGGTGNLLTMSSNNGIGALSGTIDGAAYGQPTGPMQEVADGVFEFPGLHYFLDKDGSSLFTNDKTTMHVDKKAGIASFRVAYTVVTATGRFAGYGGTFYSRVILTVDESGNIPKDAIGFVRFEGEICRL